MFFDNFNSRIPPRNLIPNVTLEGVLRLYFRQLEEVTGTFLQSPDSFKTNNAIAGTYICRAENQIGTREVVVNIAVKGNNETDWLVYSIIIICYSS